MKKSNSDHRADILFPGYGVQLEALAHEQNSPEIAEPLGILNEKGFNATSYLAEQSLQNGANIATLNLFWTRKLIQAESRENLETFTEVTKRNLLAILQAEQNSGIKSQHIVASLGPGAENCYDPDTSLAFSEAKEFHSLQSRLILGVDEKLIPWFETFSTIDEARGAAAGIDGPAFISFVLDQNGDLRSGETVLEAVKSVLKTNPNIRFGANCFPIEAAEKTLNSLGDYVKNFAVIYPNASSLDPTEFDGSDGSTTLGLINSSHTAGYLNYLAQKYQLEIIGGCCGYNHSDILALSNTVRKNLVNTLIPPTDKTKKCDCSQFCNH